MRRRIRHSGRRVRLPVHAVFRQIQGMIGISTDSDRHVTEAIANAVTHGLGLAGSIVALPILILAAAARNDPAQVAGAAIYGASLVILFAASTVYHSFVTSPARHVLRVIDHSAIYILIAGSYTPFALGPLRGPFGYALLVAVWTMAAAGIAMKFMRGFTRPLFSVGPYIVMGWIAVIGIKPLIENVGRTGVAWMVAGGLIYTGGVVFYVYDKRLRYGHAIWHLCVLAGSACHFVAVLRHSGV
ncbi:MAG: PAQR family membrane homeostasis protein TrhA [Gemmatimonadaceae bacterium]